VVNRPPGIKKRPVDVSSASNAVAMFISSRFAMNRMDLPSNIRSIYSDQIASDFFDFWNTVFVFNEKLREQLLHLYRCLGSARSHLNRPTGPIATSWTDAFRRFARSWLKSSTGRFLKRHSPPTRSAISMDFGTLTMRASKAFDLRPERTKRPLDVS